jgi:ribosomal protein S4
MDKDRFEGLRYIKNIIKRILVAQMKILPEDLFALPMVLARLPFSSSRTTRVQLILHGHQ